MRMFENTMKLKIFYWMYVLITLARNGGNNHHHKVKVFSQLRKKYEPQFLKSGYKHKQEVSHSAILLWPNITFLFLYIESFLKVLLK